MVLLEVLLFVVFGLVFIVLVWVWVLSGGFSCVYVLEFLNTVG